MAELIGGIILVLVTAATVVALLVTLSVLLPGMGSQTSRILASMPGRSFILGAVNFLFFFAIAAVLGQIGERLPGGLGGLFSLAALFIALVILAMMTLGLAGLATLLAERMDGAAAANVGQTLRAATLLVAAGLAPVVGWFILTPLALLTGLGATIIALVQRANQLLADGT